MATNEQREKTKKMHNKKTLSMYVTAIFDSKSYTSRIVLSCVAYYERSSYWRKVWQLVRMVKYHVCVVYNATYFVGGLFSGIVLPITVTPIMPII